MTQEGPSLQSLIRRLQDTPSIFLAEPRIGAKGQLLVSALVADLLRAVQGHPILAFEGAHFQKVAAKDRNWLRLVQVTTWLLFDPWFHHQPKFIAPIESLCKTPLLELAKLIAVEQFVEDPDRREELVRLCLKHLNLRPTGESIAQAQDRFTTLDSVEQQRVFQATKAAEEAAKRKREEIARRLAEEEAAAKAMRE